MTKEEKNFLIGFMAANIVSGLYILFEHLFKPMPIEWRAAASILIGIVFLLSKAVLKKDSWVKSVMTFLLIYAIPILHRREILYLIKKFISIIAYNDKTKRFYIAAAVLILVICLRKVILKGFKKAAENSLLSIAAMWSAAAVLILSKCSFPKQETFFDAVIQWTAYFLAASAFVALFTHLTVFVMYIYSKIRKTEFAKSIDISFFIFGFLAAGVGIYFNSQKITDAFNKPEYSNVIKYIMLVFGASYAAALIGSSKGIKNFCTWLRIFLNNEAFSKFAWEKIGGKEYGRYLAKISLESPAIDDYLNGSAKNLTPECAEIIGYISCSDKCLDICKTAKGGIMPNGLSGISALYTAKFIFGVRDFFRSVFGNVFGTLAPQGIIMGAVTDVFDLFTGRDNEYGEK